MMSKPLLAALLVTAGLTIFAWWQDKEEAAPELDAPARPARTAASSASHASMASAAQHSTIASRASAASSVIVNLFPRQNWAPPPTPTPVPPPPPPPTAPPLPFVIVASWHDSGIDQYFVEAQGQQILLCNTCNSMGRIHPGETLLGVYRLDKLERNMITFTYLPLNQQQQLPTGGTP
ncbi:hypothetical protein [Chitinilyticum piscinae]|uniref:Uncharacterized protein n=1 Tax=Chitinilyticum piscinae TaxID=2866724 RepID=A0A8J7K2R8_9NEIS|nr:hypothetical protein [Chitinilyticum piscinae]MBE9610402.1 hypothetical protein [Chitinilyticum piscinae]